MDRFRHDLRQAVRLLVKHPGFTAVAVLSLALGIGANTAIFSLVNALLLRPMPVARPSEIVSVFTSDFSGPLYGASSYPDYLDFRRVDALSGLAAWAPTPVALAQGGESQRLFAEAVSANYFDVLGVRPAAGPWVRAGRGLGPARRHRDRARPLAARIRIRPRRHRPFGHPQRDAVPDRRRGPARIPGRHARPGHGPVDPARHAGRGAHGAQRADQPRQSRRLPHRAPRSTSGRRGRPGPFRCSSRRVESRLPPELDGRAAARPPHHRGIGSRRPRLSRSPRARSRLHGALDDGGGPRPADRLREPRQPPARARVHAAPRDRDPPGPGSGKSGLDPPAAHRERPPEPPRRRGRRPGSGLDGGPPLDLPAPAARPRRAGSDPRPARARVRDLRLDRDGRRVRPRARPGRDAPGRGECSQGRRRGHRGRPPAVATAQRARGGPGVGRAPAPRGVGIVRAQPAQRAHDRSRVRAGGLAMASVDLVLGGYKEEAGRAFYVRALEEARALPGVVAATFVKDAPLGLGGSRRRLWIEGYTPRPTRTWKSR